MIQLTEAQRVRSWKEGYLAYEGYFPRESNPYPKGYSSNTWWDHGWTEAHKDWIDEQREGSLL